ncbi:MAG TPA: HAMP domain-containing sensor histidine kinase [Microthrixaceae bacterium]|nr:HAMP domain-containing sensor histidine kinase [Microthrixaceae bacterium]
MSLRTKLVAALAVLAASAAVLIGVFGYRATAQRLDAEVERSIENASQEVVEQVYDMRRVGGPGDRIDRGAERGSDEPTQGFPGDFRRDEMFANRVVGAPRFDFEQSGVSPQLIAANGRVWPLGSVELPVTDADRAVADRDRPGVELTRDVEVDGVPFRMLTSSLGQASGAVQTARSLEENQRVLDSLLRRIVLATGVVVVAAGLIGWVIARQITSRLVRLTGAAESVARTGRLDVEVPVEGTDEAGRLGEAFNGMLVALAASKDDQQRLVQDAGHELRTPLTSLRTNVDVLRRFDELDPKSRTRLLADLDGETRELTALVNELVELATDRYTDEPVQRVELREIVEAVADRSRRRTGRIVTVDADAAVVEARPLSLERAVGNLVDNAAKFDDSGAPIEVTVRSGRVEVADRGPGIDPADLPRIFDRFHRSTTARSRPGSGLGLAIVRDVVESHGGTVFAGPRDGGGSVIGFVLPVADAATDRPDGSSIPT